MAATTATDTPSPVLEATGVVKEFLGVQALKGVDFRLHPGEVHALMGENGAGKSTLIKCLTGVYEAEAGTIRVKGAEVSFTGPLQAQGSGVATVYQEINLCPSLSVAENVLLGREPRRFGGMIHWKELRKRARALMARLELDVDVSASLGSQPLAVQQMVAIARAVDVDASVLILDEPTSSLDAEEVKRLFRVMRRLREEGVAILFVSHFLEQIYEISDRITVLRDGRLIGEWTVAELPRRELVGKMLGQELSALEAEEHNAPRDVVETAAAEAFVTARGVGRKGAVAPSTWTWRRAKSPGSPGCSARDGARPPASSPAPTAPTAGSSPSAARTSRCARRERRSTRGSRTSRRTVGPTA